MVLKIIMGNVGKALIFSATFAISAVNSCSKFIEKQKGNHLRVKS